MSSLIAKHTDDGGEVRTIKVEAKRCNPVVDRLGFVKIIGGKFKGLTKIKMDFLEENFELECS